MAGTVPQRPASTGSATGNATGSSTSSPMVSASLVNSFRVTSVAERLAKLARSQRYDSWEFFNLCLALSRGIDYAVANNEIPAKTQELPLVLKQVYQHKGELLLQAAIMVLMLSVKSACKSGWFLMKEANELLTLANEIGMGFCTPGDITIEPSNPPPVISKILYRFYPQMKIGHMFASIEVKPGFGAYVTDFHIPKNKVSSPQEKIRLFVAQTDDTETSSCIISPPRVNFLLNGKGVERRTNVAMDNGPQCPTNVTSMLKYGTNLLQAVGHFNGSYIIAIAFMSETSSFNVPGLPDYVRPLSTVLDSDSDIVEGSSRISLNCPISFKRIKTPVKGQLCKHHQCFDYENFIRINSRRPHWRCPHCNHSICYNDIRIDQHMVKVLREVGENVMDILISADGSWKPVMERDDYTDQLRGQTVNDKQDGLDQCELPKSMDNVVDLTVGGTDENDIMDVSDTQDRKPFKDTAAPALTVPMEVNNTPEIPLVGDDFWSGHFFVNSTGHCQTVATSTSTDVHTSGAISCPTNLALTPVLTDAVSPSLSREPMDVCGTSQQANPLTHNQFLMPDNMQLHLPQDENAIVNREYGRAMIPRNVSRNPIAVQALPAQPLLNDSHQRPRNETDRQHLFSRSSLNVNPTSETSPSPLQHQSVTQNWDYFDRQQFHQSVQQQIVGLPAPSQSPGAYQGSSGLPADRPHQPAPHLRSSQIVSQPTLTRPSHLSPMQARQVGSQSVVGQGGSPTVAGQSPGNMANSRSRPSQAPRPLPSVPVQLPRSLPSVPVQLPRSLPSVPVHFQPSRTGTGSPLFSNLRTSMGEQRTGNMDGGVQPISRVDSTVEMLPEQNWRPTGRMRGSLTGRALSSGLNQFIIQPTQHTQAARPRTPDPVAAPTGGNAHQPISAGINQFIIQPTQHTQGARPRTPEPVATPTGGSAHQAISAALNQFLIESTQQTQTVRPPAPSPDAVSTPGGSTTQLQVSAQQTQATTFPISISQLQVPSQHLQATILPASTSELRVQTQQTEAARPPTPAPLSDPVLAPRSTSHLQVLITNNVNAPAPPPPAPAPTPDPIASPRSTPQLQVLIANNVNAHAPPPLANPSNGDSNDLLENPVILPDNQQG